MVTNQPISPASPRFCRIDQSGRVESAAAAGVPFSRMSLQMIQAVKFIAVTPTQKLVAFVLADCHNAATGQCNPSGSYLERVTGFSNRTIWTAIDALESMGHLTVRNKGNGSKNCYVMHPKTSEGGSLVDCETSEGGSPVNLLQPVKEVHTTCEPVAKTSEPVAKTSEGGSHITVEPEENQKEPEFSVRVPAPRFRSPSLEAWQAYGKSLSPEFPAIESERAWNHYESNGWKVGRNPCKNWQACCRTCHGRWRSESANPATGRSNASCRPGGHADHLHPEHIDPTPALF